MAAEKFLHSRIVVTEREFSNKIDDIDFLDIVPLGESSAIFLMDGNKVTISGVSAISSRVYSTAKLLLWRTFFYTVGSFSAIGGLQSRLVLTGRPNLYFF